MKADIEKNFSEADISLIEGKGGVFEVRKDGVLIFSKKSEGRFPEHEEILSQLSN